MPTRFSRQSVHSRFVFHRRGAALAAAMGMLAGVCGVEGADPPAVPTSAPVRVTGPQRAQMAEEYGRKALAAYDSGDLMEAGELADEALKNRPDQPEATIVLGLLMKDRQPRDAIEYIRKYNETDRGKRDYRGYEAAGDLFMRSNSPGSAMDAFTQALRWTDNVNSKRPVKAEIQMKLAEAQSQRGLCKKAIENAEQAGRGLQQTSDLQWRLARVYNKCGKEAESGAAVDAAMKLLRGELQAMTREDEIRFNDLYTKLMMRDEILRVRYKSMQDRLEKLATAKKTSPETRVAMARALVEQGENDRMVKLTRAAGLMEDAVREDAKLIDSYL